MTTKFWFNDKLPWFLSFAASTTLVLVQNNADNQYQTRVDEYAFGKSGDLRLLNVKAENNLGALITLGGLVTSVYSLSNLLKEKDDVTDTNPTTAITYRDSEIRDR